MSHTFKDILTRAMMDECRIIKHLFTKIPEGQMDYRPSEKQRSVLELLRYIATMAEASAVSVFAGDFKGYREIAQRSKDMTADQFPEMMDQQMDRLETLMAPLTDEELISRKTKNPVGEEVSLYEGLQNMPMKWLTGYRMQLFLYAKQAGNAEIDTANNWLGMDSKRD